MATTGLTFDEDHGNTQTPGSATTPFPEVMTSSLPHYSLGQRSRGWRQQKSSICPTILLERGMRKATVPDPTYS